MTTTLLSVGTGTKRRVLLAALLGILEDCGIGGIESLPLRVIQYGTGGRHAGRCLLARALLVGLREVVCGRSGSLEQEGER